MLKFILQLGSHAKKFVEIGGVKSLIQLFIEFFSESSVILSSFKALMIEVLTALSFWDFAMV